MTKKCIAHTHTHTHTHTHKTNKQTNKHTQFLRDVSLFKSLKVQQRLVLPQGSLVHEMSGGSDFLSNLDKT